MTIETIKAICNDCGGGLKNHRVLHQEIVPWEEDIDDGQFSISGGDIFYTLKCLGCDRVHLRHDSWFSEDVDAAGNPVTHTTYYPPLISRRKPDWYPVPGLLFSVDVYELQGFLDEIYAALHNNSLRLAVMGVRALLERLMIEKINKDHGSIGKNVEEFLKIGYVSEKYRDVFKNCLIEAGNGAMHRGYNPEPDEVNTLLDITEHLISTMYVHPNRAEWLSKKIPPRSSQKKQSID